MPPRRCKAQTAYTKLEIHENGGQFSLPNIHPPPLRMLESGLGHNLSSGKLSSRSSLDTLGTGLALPQSLNITQVYN
jgi:hypothetical protein